MTEEITLVGRDKEIQTIEQDLHEHIGSKSNRIIHLVGAPGTGKTMCAEYILDRLSQNPLYKFNKVYINCMKISSCKLILSRICSEMNLKLPKVCSESDMVDMLTQVFNKSRTILVLDELDKLPKAQNVDFVQSCVKWPIIMIGISNIIDLTSRYDTVIQVAGRANVTRVVFVPYNSKTIMEIFKWYMKYDENYSVANELITTKGLEMIAKKTARENGDIRQALNGFRSLIDDSLSTNINNLSCVMNSIRKRQKKIDNDLNLVTQIILMICASAKCQTIDYVDCVRKLLHICKSIGQTLSNSEIRPLLENLECLNLISIKRECNKKTLKKEKISLKVDLMELDMLLTKKEIVEKYFV